uniref:STE/STE11/BCK1 protein kinase n=1 Tax=Ganoderma boninense TaxID=34458 RepID=A0A5K1JRD6_9APHY|nr:Ste11-1 [Ganoderma boninense]VWO94206.1 STE/STE11/BCK1 protein kinase [Ganoderma boninense]
MSDDARSIHTRPPPQRRKRILVVSNASPESSEDEGPPPEPQKPYYYPRPLPSPSISLPSAEQPYRDRRYSPSNNSHLPPPLTTNLPPYSSSRSNPSNPALSSPSSTSSPAVESTPPPSTPGLGVPSLHIPDEGTIRQDMITPAASDRNDSTPQASRPRGVFERIRSHVPHQVHERRYSSSGSRPATSPVVSTPDSYLSQSFRSSPMEKVIVLVTTDAENLHVVDITGAMTPAFIRERIFTKLQISDEDQAKFAIYRTEIGQFAIGDALTDDELFGLYKDFGDQTGQLKLLVSHTSASVHEPGPYDPPLTSTVNTIPPPVLPQQTLYAPLRPNRDTRIRQGSQSSASEPHHAEVGYEASVSDDLDHGDGDGGLRDARDYGRPPLPVRALPIPSHRPPSPSGYHRSRSPISLLSPDRRHDPYHASIGAFPLPGTSPQASRFVDDHHPLPPLPPEAPAPSLPDPPVEQRERSHTNEGQISTYTSGLRTKEERGREQRHGKRRETLRKDSGRYTKPEQEDSRPRNDPWTIVPGDVPSSEYRKDRPRTPQESRSNTRAFPTTPPSAISSYRNVPGESSTRRKPLQVPINWPVNWKHIYAPAKSDKPALSPPGNSLIRHGAKSMTDMRGAFKHPPSLQPGRPPRPPPPQPPLPLITRPSTSGNSTSVLGGPPLPSTSSSSDTSTIHPDQIASASDIARSVLSSRQIMASYASSPATTVGYLTSPASQQDPFPRPHSALGESSSAPLAQPRYPHSNQTSDPSHIQQTPPRSPVAPPTPVTAQSLPSDSPAAAVGVPGDGFAKRGAIDEDGGTQTVRADNLKWLEGFIDENLAEGTARPRMKQSASSQQLPTPPSTTEITTLSSPLCATFVNHASQGDDDSDSDGGTSFWLVPPKKTEKLAESQQSSNASKTRPPLTPLSIEGSPNSTPNGLPAVNSYDYGRSPPNQQQLEFLASPPPSSGQPRTPRRMPAQKKHKDRISKFDNNFDITWAPRPPPEVMFEKLEEYFPEHDLDKPVIETPSGGTSPTATEAPANPAPSRFRHKKSIRLVAAEHRRQLDRTSRGDNSTIAPLSRKRHTKMWGGKLEEVTTEQGTGPISSTSDASPGGAKPIFRWVRGELIGKGTYGRVYLALNATTGEMIAVKQVEIPRTASDKDDSRQVTVVEALKLESETLKDLDHPNIVSYLGFEETPTFLSIFLEYVPGGSIASCLRKHGRFDEEVTKSFTGQILAGLEYLHSKNILHRDLKADNILVETSGVCKISDFGISKRTDDINMAAVYTAMQGTVFWMAPEVVNSKAKGYNSKIDIWSVGCVVFEMWTGQRPWLGQEAMAVLIHLYQTKQPPPVPVGIELSSLADDLRLRCFAADPDLRPTAAELRKHPYLELQPGWSFNGFK